MHRRSDDLEAEIARSKSFTGKAVATLVLYIFLWLPGFIANIVFLREATAAESVAGQGLPGTGCLAVLLWANLIPIAIVFLSVCAAVTLKSN